jgi:serine/threonine protein kinase
MNEGVNVKPSNSMVRLEKVGEGSYGIVYSSKFANNEKRYAVKRNFKELSTSWIGNIHEADVLVRLKGHPCIVELKSIAIGDPFEKDNPMSPKNQSGDKKNMKEDKMHFVLEYANDSGDSYLKSYNFNYANSRLILCQVLLGLKYMHMNGIIHRDIKPANILINFQNNVPYAKICDFGMSCNRIKNIPSTPGVVTCWYRAPEICFAHPYYDEKTDVWSFGCLLFEFISKKPWLLSTPDDDTKIVNSIIASLEDKPTDEDIEYLVSKSRKNIKFKTNDVIRKRLKFESQMKFNFADRKDFENTCGPYEDYIDLLKKCLQINPTKRINIDEILEHKFFSFYKDYISTVTKYNYNLSNTNNQIIISDTQERRWALNTIIKIVNDNHEYSWFKHLTIFHAVDLFERYMDWSLSENNSDKSKTGRRVAVYSEETENRGRVHDQKETELRIWVCLYIMHKYYAVLEHPKKWKNFAPEEFHDKEIKQIGRNFEYLMIKYVCNYRVFRNTIIEIHDSKCKSLNDTFLFKLLDAYMNIEYYIGSAEGLYNILLKNIK